MDVTVTKKSVIFDGVIAEWSPGGMQVKLQFRHIDGWTTVLLSAKYLDTLIEALQGIRKEIGK